MSRSYIKPSCRSIARFRKSFSKSLFLSSTNLGENIAEAGSPDQLPPATFQRSRRHGNRRAVTRPANTHK